MLFQRIKNNRLSFLGLELTEIFCKNFPNLNIFNQGFQKSSLLPVIAVTFLGV